MVIVLISYLPCFTLLLKYLDFVICINGAGWLVGNWLFHLWWMSIHFNCLTVINKQKKNKIFKIWLIYILIHKYIHTYKHTYIHTYLHVLMYVYRSVWENFVHSTIYLMNETAYFADYIIIGQSKSFQRRFISLSANV